MLLYTYRAFLLLYFITCSKGQQRHLLKYINSGSNTPPSSVTAQFTSAGTAAPEADPLLQNTRNKFARADRICVSGMWALYNTTDFGEAVEDTTTVISVRGTDINTCTKPGQIPVLRSIQSVRYLGAADYTTDGILIYSQPYFLGGLWNVQIPTATTPTPVPTGISGFSLGSIAITGPSTSAFVICGDRNNPCVNGVCINMRNFANLFLQRNTPRDTTLPSGFGWPKTVRQVFRVTADECSNYPNPPPLNVTRRVEKRHIHDNIEVEVLTSASS